MTRRTNILLITGIAVVVAVIYWSVVRDPGSNILTSTAETARAASTPDKNTSTNLLSSDAADAQRVLHYQDFASIEQAYRLPSDFARREALYVIAGRADSRQLRALIGEAKKIPEQARRLEVLEILLLRYVELEPRGALRSALDMDRTAVSRLVPPLIAAWSGNDLAAAVAATRELPTATLKQTAAHALLARHAANGPEGVRQLAAQLDLPGQAAVVLFETQAGTLLEDPHQAIEAALALPGATRRDQLTKIAQAWAQVAPEEAWDYVTQLTDPLARTTFQNAVIATWAAGQPDAAFARVTELPAGWQRQQLLRRVTRELARHDPKRAVELLPALESTETEPLQLLIANEWSRNDAAGAAQWVESQNKAVLGRLAYEIAGAYVTQEPEQALAWALRISQSPGRNLWCHMLGIMAQQNPQEALSLAQSAEIPAQRNQALGAVLATIATSDPALAKTLLEKIPPGDARMRAALEAGRRIAANGPEAAIAWYESQDNAQIRLQGMDELAQTLSSRNVEAAAGLIDRVPRDARPRWAATVALIYAGLDADKGIQWVSKFDGEPGYVNILGAFASSLVTQNPDKALQLIERTTDGKERDEALGRILLGLGSHSPELASRWISKIADDEKRVMAVGNLAQVWGSSDFAAAQKWALSLDSSNRDRAISHLAMSNALSVDDALTLIGEIRSPQEVTRTVVNTALRIARSDPEGVKTLLRRYPLDPQHQQTLDTALKQQSRGW